MSPSAALQYLHSAYTHTAMLPFNWEMTIRSEKFHPSTEDYLKRINGRHDLVAWYQNATKVEPSTLNPTPYTPNPKP